MMARLIAFALNADEALEFGRGLSSEGEPDLVKKDLTGAIDLWIDVGLPDEREIRKAAGRAAQVKVYIYGGRSAALWWDQNQSALRRLDNGGKEMHVETTTQTPNGEQKRKVVYTKS